MIRSCHECNQKDALLASAVEIGRKRCVGQFTQAIVVQKVQDNQFVIQTDKPNVEVSWQVTGIRKDPAAQRDTYQVEVNKEEAMKGKRLYQ